MTLLAKPWKVDAEGERLYVYAPGKVCLDVHGGTSEDRRRVLALLAHTRNAFRILRALADDRGVNKADAEAVLRDAGVSDPHVRVEET